MKNMRVLLVDDEEEFLAVLAERLRMRHLDVTAASSGPEALKAMSQHFFDVAVLDVRMAGMDGIEVLRQIIARQLDVEVILLTGHASIESGLNGMRLGAFDYLIKPCDIEDLIAKINNAYKRKQRKQGCLKFCVSCLKADIFSKKEVRNHST